MQNGYGHRRYPHTCHFADRLFRRGKTTLLNHLIRNPDAGRIAVIMNELGDVGLDHDLIEESTEEIVLMQSGCICCSIRGDFLKSLGKLVARRQNGDLDFDRIVIETTGIADPGPILHSLVVGIVRQT